MRFRVVLLAAVFAACTSAPDVSPVPNTTTTPSTTTTGKVTTTTKPALLSLDGAPAAWEEAVQELYGPACGAERGAEIAALADLEEATDCPSQGRAAIAAWDDTVLAAAAIGADLVYGIDEGNGFEIVAVRLPSLGQEQGWYGEVPKVMVAVGSDARPNQDPNRSRADSIHLLALDGNGNGGVIGIPRDSWVRIAGAGNNKINASLSVGGPDVMMQTLHDVTGLDLDGYALTGFVGFQEMLGNVLGGVDIELPSSVVDSAAGANLTAGRVYLNGPQALSLARARKSLPSGDLTRQFNGGLLLLAALSSAQAYGPLHLPKLIADSAPWISTNLTPAQLLQFSALALVTPINAIGNRVAPGRIGTAGSASVVFLDESVQDLFADLADGNLTPEESVRG
ncbi:MAG: LCP family protein [Acidimicrobiia bacterium]